MLPGPCPAVKHIWPRTRLRHARENVAAYLCSYPSKGLNGSSAPPRSNSESGPDRGCPPGAEPAPNPAAEAPAPRHPATRIQLPEMQHQHHVKISKAATHYIPPLLLLSPAPFSSLFSPTFKYIFLLWHRTWYQIGENPIRFLFLKLSSAHKPQGGPVASARKTVIYMEMRQPRFFPLLRVF